MFFHITPSCTENVPNRDFKTKVRTVTSVYRYTPSHQQIHRTLLVTYIFFLFKLNLIFVSQLLYEWMGFGLSATDRVGKLESI